MKPACDVGMTDLQISLSRATWNLHRTVLFVSAAVAASDASPERRALETELAALRLHRALLGALATQAGVEPSELPGLLQS